nr:DUF4192 domain-containing protein [Allosalinactinospora lopnorensis]
MVTEHASGPVSPTFTLGEPAEIIAVIPYLLGYHPTDMLVVLGLHGPAARVRITFRCDLAADAPEHATELAEQVTGTLSAEGCDAALAVAYGPAARATPCVDALRARAGEAGVALREALRFTDGRYWSYLCSAPACCPAEGVPVDTSRSPVTAAAVLSGFTAWRDRDQVRRFLAPVEGADRLRMRQATEEAERRGGQLREKRADAGGRDAFGTAFRIEGVRTVRETITAALRGELPDDPDRIAWLGVLLTSVRVRDEAWARISSDTGATRSVRTCACGGSSCGTSNPPTWRPRAPCSPWRPGAAATAHSPKPHWTRSPRRPPTTRWPG